ncbi:MAG TPA: MFS transporter [Opitutus sp.]|nr:MFS transporter [Opitutus sp.]
MAAPAPAPPRSRWLNSTVLGIGLASLFSDWSHEIATAILPAFLATMGVAAAWVGLIEGVADGLSSFAKLASGHWTDRLARRKPIAVVGYLTTTLCTASFGLATTAWQVLLSRSGAWLGRGVRTPVRKALLAASVTPETYGRAFGFERMMDTVGAIVGPATAYVLLRAYQHRFPPVFAWTLLPGFVAAGCIGFLVRERSRPKIGAVSFREGLRNLPAPYRKFLVAVGVFGAGDFAHTLLILLATQRLAPLVGAGRAGAIAVALYVAHNVFYATFALIVGRLADRWPKPVLLSAGYAIAAIMAVAIIALPTGVWTLALVFAFGGIYVGIEETLEDSLCAELVPKPQHGLAFGVLATVNGFGDFLSSVIVGVLWSALGPTIAFGYTAILALAGALLALRLRAPQ